jgi:hypothetical protein
MAEKKPRLGVTGAGFLIFLVDLWSAEEPAPVRGWKEAQQQRLRACD